jgi:hypothetical protein
MHFAGVHASKPLMGRPVGEHGQGVLKGVFFQRRGRVKTRKREDVPNVTRAYIKRKRTAEDSMWARPRALAVR